MDSYSFGRLQASFAIMIDQITILGYLVDKYLNKEPISKEEHKIIIKVKEEWIRQPKI